MQTCCCGFILHLSQAEIDVVLSLLAPCMYPQEIISSFFFFVVSFLLDVLKSLCTGTIYFWIYSTLIKILFSPLCFLTQFFFLVNVQNNGLHYDLLYTYIIVLIIPIMPSDFSTMLLCCLIFSIDIDQNTFCRDFSLTSHYMHSVVRAPLQTLVISFLTALQLTQLFLFSCDCRHETESGQEYKLKSHPQ